VEKLHVRRLREETAHAHGGHPVGFRKSAADEEIRVTGNQRERSDAAEFVVGFVDQYGRMRRRLEDGGYGIEPCSCAGRVIGVGDQDGFGPRRDRPQQGVKRERDLRRNIGDRCYLRPGDFGVKTVHRVRRGEDDYFVVIVDVGVDENVDGLVGAISQK